MTRKFTDNRGDDWVVFLDTTAAKRVRNLLEVDLLSFASEQQLARLSDDYILLVDVLWVLCEEQAAQRGVSDVDFGRRMVGAPLEAARPALLRAIVDFFPPRQQAVLAAAVDKIFECSEQMMRRAERLVADGTLDRVVEEQIDKADRELRSALGGSLSTSSPADSASTRGRSRSPN